MKSIQTNRLLGVFCSVLCGVLCGILLSFGNSAAASSMDASAELPICEPSGGSGGLAAGSHDVIIAGRPVHVLVSPLYDPAKPTYLAFYLHGSEGGYFRNDHRASKVNQFIDEAGWVYVAPQAPALSDFPDSHNWLADWQADTGSGPLSQANEQLIIDVLEHMYANYNVCKNVLFGYGASSGAHFFDGYFFPRHGDRYPAFMNVSCGAGSLSSSSPTYKYALLLSQNPDILARSELHYTIGTEDFLYDDFLTSSATYQSLGFTVTTDVLDGVEHCDYDTDAKAAAYWQQKSSAPLNPSPAFLLGSNSLNLEAEVGWETIFTYDFSISSPYGYDLTWTATESIPWLTLQATQGSTPNTIRTTISTRNLSAGTYTGSIEITTRVNGTTAEPPRTATQLHSITLVMLPNGEPIEPLVDIYLPLMVVASE